MKIISGAQTGADRAALDFAIEQGLEYGGWLPKGRKAEDGRVPDKYDKMMEMTSSAYPPRTQMNVRSADITFIFHEGPFEAESGCALTVKLCQQLNKPHVVHNLALISDKESADFIRPIMKGDVYGTINVAGTRGSKSATIYDRVKAILTLAWTT